MGGAGRRHTHCSRRRKHSSAQAGGAFELTIAPLALAWGITTDAPRVLQQDEIDALLPLVDDSGLLLESGTARLQRPGQAVDLGGIAKGAACDVAKEVYDEYGIRAALCWLGGSSIYARGVKPDGEAWRLGFRDPKEEESVSLASFEIRDAVFCTSGGYERYFEQDGVRYHHILDPATGRPAQSDIVSIGILCENGAEADFWSTALFVQGREKALEYFETGGEGLLLDEDNTLYVSKALQASFELAAEAEGGLPCCLFVKAVRAYRRKRKVSVLRNEKTRRVALMGLLFALSVVLSFLEGTLTPLLGAAAWREAGSCKCGCDVCAVLSGARQRVHACSAQKLFCIAHPRCDGRRAEPRRRFVVAWRNGCPVPFQEQAFGIHTLRVRRDHT